MSHFECLACKTRLHSTQAQPIQSGIYAPVCGSLLEPAGDAHEIGGSTQSRIRISTSNSGAPVAGRLIAGRVGEIRLSEGNRG